MDIMDITELTVLGCSCILESPLPYVCFTLLWQVLPILGSTTGQLGKAYAQLVFAQLVFAWPVFLHSQVSQVFKEQTLSMTTSFNAAKRLNCDPGTANS